MLSNIIGDSSMSWNHKVIEKPPAAIIVDFSEIIYRYTPQTSFKSYLFNRVVPLVNLMRVFGVKDIIESVLILDYDNPECRFAVWEVLEHKYWNTNMDFWDHTESVETLSIIVDLVVEEVDTHIRDTLTPHNLSSEYASYLFHQWVGAGAALLTHRYAETTL